MFWSAFKASRKPMDDEVVFASTSDRLTYAIGDIHGRDDLFLKTLNEIRADAETLAEKPRLILLGDYIDRGSRSSDVLERIISLQAEEWCDLIVLLGNHELAFIKFCIDSAYGLAWLDHGGEATLASYGISTIRDRENPEKWKELQQRTLSLVPKSHLQLLCDAQIFYVAGDYLFVHGGVKPGVPIEEQSAETLLLIRDEFLSSPRASEFVIVHGHSAKEEASNMQWRIGIDTGAYATGVLTAVRLQGTERKLIQVRL